MTADDLRAARAALGLTQAEMAAWLNARIPWLRLHRGNYARWETGLVTPSPAMQAALTQALSSVDQSSKPIQQD